MRKKGLGIDNEVIQGVAVLSLTLLIVTLIPFAGPAVVIMTPLPILYYCARLGRMRGVAALAVAFLAVSGILAFLGHRANISVLVTIVVTGVMLSELLRRRYSIEKTFILASLALFFCGTGFVLYRAFLSGVAPWRMVELTIEGIVGENLKLYEQLNISEEQIVMIRENAPQIVDFFTGIFPALALSGAVLTVWLNVVTGRSLLGKNAALFPDFGDLSLWKAPEKLVWLLIAAGAMTLAPVDILDMVGMNLLIICCLVYLFQGMAITGFFFRQKKVPRMMRLLVYTLIVVQQYMVILVIAFGLFDMWVDFRKRIAGIKDVPV
ncbi:MAG: YybS family protein [Syntrophales bacterium]